MNKRKLACILLLACCITGCTSFSSSNSNLLLDAKETNNATGLSLQYKRFKGVRQHTFSIKSGQTMYLKSDVEKGDITFELKDNKNNKVFESSELHNEASMNSNVDGDFILTVTSDSENGEYSFHWE